MNSASPTCPKCGKAAITGAAFCAFCGNALPAERAPVKRADHSVPVPDRAGLTGKCAVIYTGATEEPDIRRIGRVVADAMGRPLSDVTRDLKVTKGFLCAGVESPAAVALAGKAEQALGAPALVIPAQDCIPLPPPMRMRQAAVNPVGMKCEAYTWDRTETVEAPWDDVFLISCGRLEVQHFEEALADTSSSSLIGGRAVPALVTQTRYEYLLDVVLVNPWRRLRLDQNTTAFSLTEMHQDPEHSLGILFRSAVNIERFAQGVPMNRGVSLLAAGASDAAWQSLTFLNKRDFDAYVFWVIQLVRYGRPIPG
jgi:hypothetical protein